MRKVAKISAGLLLIGSISLAQPQKVTPHPLCFVNEKTCTLEDISKILSGTSPSETKCECERGPRSTPAGLQGKKIYHIFLEEPVLTGTLVIPKDVALFIHYAPYTTLKGEIINKGHLVTLHALTYFSAGIPLYFEGKLENYDKAYLFLIPKKATIINEGSLLLSSYSGSFFHIIRSPSFAKLKPLKLYSDNLIGEVSIKNKGKLSIDNFLRGYIETQGDLYLRSPFMDSPTFEGTINILGGSVDISFSRIRNTTINGDGYTLVKVIGSTLENVNCNGVILSTFRTDKELRFVNTNCIIR